MATSTTTGPTKILVPLDGSEASEMALPLATALAGRLPGPLVILSVPEVYGIEASWYGAAAMQGGAPNLPLSELIAESRRETEAYLATRQSELARRGLVVQTIVGEAAPPDAVVRAADADVAFVVMATHGRRGLSRWAIGSVADKVLHQSRRPVVLVRSGAEPAPEAVRHVLVALDGSELAESILPPVVELARSFGARLTLAYVTLRPPRMARPDVLLEAVREHSARMARYLEDVAIRVREESITVETAALEGDDIAATVLSWQEERGSDMVALTTHGRTGWRRWAFGSVADRVLSAAATPVLLRRIVADDEPEV